MDKIDICFYCLEKNLNLYLCDVCILEQRMSNYNFQLCRSCLENHLKNHKKINEMTKSELDLYISKKGNYTGFM